MVGIWNMRFKCNASPRFPTALHLRKQFSVFLRFRENVTRKFKYLHYSRGKTSLTLLALFPVCLGLVDTKPRYAHTVVEHKFIHHGRQVHRRASRKQRRMEFEDQLGAEKGRRNLRVSSKHRPEAEFAHTLTRGR